VKLRILSPAQDEIVRVIDFYDGKALGLGAEFVEELDRIFEVIRANPHVGTPFAEAARRILLRRFPFGLVYSIEADAVVIHALAHQRRKPGYWLEGG
jgi:toxin ParE1/3/4